jgi:hypothetical protein
MDKKELDLILKKHADWLNDKEGGERADLNYIDLSNMDMRGAVMSGAVMRGADMRGADMRGADMSRADMRRADMRGADMSRADMSGAVMSGADMSGAKGIATAKDFLSQFKKDKSGIFVYKTFGAYKTPPSYWKIEAGEFIEEVVNPDRCTDCGSGINFATLDWIKNCNDAASLPIWLCKIHWEDMADVVVPYNTDGKARCHRLQLIKIVED